MKFIQFKKQQGERAVAEIKGTVAHEIKQVTSIREMALDAISKACSLEQLSSSLGYVAEHDYQQLIAEHRVLPPLDHPDPAHCLVSGTGLTHLGSASTRDKMHQQNLHDEAAMTDTMRIFQWGVKGGKPAKNQIGAQPEWFYKGDGSIVVAPGAALPLPAFAEDGGEEPEIAGLYVIGPDRQPYRIGFALGNEYSDHIMERRNYLYLAHSKLRFCSYGPELVTGDLPQHLVGTSRIIRDGQVIWEKEFLSGEDNMCHSIENLEYHHFKYHQFLQPGDIHVHYFGTATLSFADGIKTQLGDQFEIAIDVFGQPLVNQIGQIDAELPIGQVKKL